MKNLMVKSVAIAASLAAGSAFAQVGAMAGGAALNTSGATPSGAVALGIAANPRLRDALQEAQFGAGNACIGNDSELCMPSISSIELQSILQSAGGGSDWGTLYAVPGMAAGAPFGSTHFCTGTTAPPAGLSALSAEVRALVTGLGVGCNNASPAGSGVQAVLAPLAGDATTCLTATEGFAGAGALGVATPDVTNANVRFIKIDGESPSEANMLSGNYNHWINTVGGAPVTAGVSSTFGASVAATAQPLLIRSDGGGETTANECGARRLNAPTAGDLSG